MRIKDQKDSLAWSEFVDIYGPLIYRFGRRKGLQDADATDFTQDVFSEISQQIAKFTYNPELGKFRNWLFVVSSRVLGHRLRKTSKQAQGSGESRVANMLGQIPSPGEDDDVWEKEYRQHLFSWACERVRHQFKESTWKAFIATAVNGQSAATVANTLDLSVGAVYIAKTRVTQKLKDIISSVDDSL